jgi:RNA polymerase sigma factor (TIGR02999 family)
MAEVMEILSRIEQGDPAAADELLPQLYDELRKLAAAKIAQEKPGHTLQATALLHEAYLRVAKGGDQQTWESQRHFFAAAAEAMRRILVESARRKRRLKHGGALQHADRDVNQIEVQAENDEIIAVHEALDELATVDAAAAQLVKLYYFTGMTIEEAANVVGVSPRTAYRDWAFARAWLKKRLGDDEISPS